MSDLIQSSDVAVHIWKFYLQLWFKDGDQQKHIFDQLCQFYAQFCHNSPFAYRIPVVSLIKQYVSKINDGLHAITLALPKYRLDKSVTHVDLLVRIPSNLLCMSSPNCLIGRGLDSKFMDCCQAFVDRLHEENLLPADYTLVFKICTSNMQWTDYYNGIEIHLDNVSIPNVVTTRSDTDPVSDEQFINVDVLFASLCVLKLNGVAVENVIDEQDRYYNRGKQLRFL